MPATLCHSLDDFRLVYRCSTDPNGDIYRCQACGELLEAPDFERAAATVTALETAEYDYFNFGLGEVSYGE